MLYWLRSNPSMLIETARLQIRRHHPDDWRDLFEYLSLPEIYAYEPGGPISEEDARKLARERAEGESFLPVILKESGKMIGHLYFNRFGPEEFLTWELGYIFNPQYYNRGYATEAARAIIRYGFERLHAHRIVAHCNPKNIASVRVLEKAGLVKEGLFRKKAFFRKDETGRPLWHDCAAYGLLEPDK